MYLVIDTATRDLGVALMDEAEVAGQFHWRTRQNHTKELVPAIRHLLDKAELGLNHLKGIVVSLGPGGFSGLRVGMTTAKGLAVGIDAPIVAVNTLDAAAHPFAGLERQVCAVMSVGRGEVAAAMYRTDGAEMEKTVAEHLTTIERLAESIGEPTIFCGPITGEMETEIRGRLRDRGLTPRGVGKASRVVAMGEIGIRKIGRGEADDPVTLQPLYIRRPSITKPSRPPGG